MIVDYELEPADSVAISQERQRSTPQFPSQLYYFVILPLLVVGLAVAAQSFIIAIVFTFLFIASGLLVREWTRRQAVRLHHTEENFPRALRRWRSTLREDGVEFSSGAGNSFLRWSVIKEVSRGARYVIFVLSPIRRYHIPIRSFTDENHIQQFVSEAQSHVKRNSE